jgi:hypothetical protein
MSLEEIARTGALVVKATEWPPKPPRLDDVVAFAGFSGAGRRIVAPVQIVFEPFHGTAFVESVSPEKISCPIPREWIVPIKGMRFRDSGEDTAGISGGPLICFDRGDILSWRLLE